MVTHDLCTCFGHNIFSNFKYCFLCKRPAKRALRSLYNRSSSNGDRLAYLFYKPVLWNLACSNILNIILTIWLPFETTIIYVCHLHKSFYIIFKISSLIMYNIFYFCFFLSKLQLCLSFWWYYSLFYIMKSSNFVSHNCRIWAYMYTTFLWKRKIV